MRGPRDHGINENMPIAAMMNGGELNFGCGIRKAATAAAVAGRGRRESVISDAKTWWIWTSQDGLHEIFLSALFADPQPSQMLRLEERKIDCGQPLSTSKYLSIHIKTLRPDQIKLTLSIRPRISYL